jgi:hypothetical protein
MASILPIDEAFASTFHSIGESIGGCDLSLPTRHGTGYTISPSRTKLLGNMLADAQSKHLFFLISISYTIRATVSAYQSILSVVHLFY